MRLSQPVKDSMLFVLILNGNFMTSRLNTHRSSYYGALQNIVDALFADSCVKSVRRLDVVIAAESTDLPEELVEIISLLPPGMYTRRRLCDQLNSALGGHAWGQVYGTVE